jgi:hypothetical protein
MVFNWTDTLAMCNEARTTGRDVVYQVWRTPAWASDAADQINGITTSPGPYGVGESNVPRNVGGRPQYVYDFVTMLLRQTNATYQGIKYIEYGNEPEFWANATVLNAYIAGGGKPFSTGTVAREVPCQAQMRRACDDFNAVTPASRKVIPLMTSHWNPVTWVQQSITTDSYTGISGYNVGAMANIHTYNTNPNKAYGNDMLAGANTLGPAYTRTLMDANSLARKPIVVSEWGVGTNPTDVFCTAFNAQPFATQVRELKRFIAGAAMSDIALFIISNFSNLTGTTTPGTPQSGWTYATDPGPTAITEFYNVYLRGKTLLPFPATCWFPDRSVRLSFSDGTSIIV